MTGPVAVASLTICLSMGTIVVAGTLSGLLLYWIESRIHRGEH